MGFWSKLIHGDVYEDFGTTEPTGEAKKEEPSNAELEALIDGFYEKREALFAAYEPKGPAFKIVQVPAGHFVIARRHVNKAYDPNKYNYFGFGMGKRFTTPGGFFYTKYDTVERWEKYDPAPYESYETVKNPEAPKVERVSSYSRYTSDYDRVTGYADMIFNVFEDAEAYLFRMANQAEHVTEYDYPPLKKRPKKATG